VDWKVGLAQCLFRQRKFSEAATLCGELIELDPETEKYWLLQANAYLGMAKPMKAAENYEYLDLNGKSTVKSLNTLGDIYVNEGLADMAADAYLRAMEKDESGKPDRFLRDAEILAARGAYAEAVGLLARLKEAFMGQFDREERKGVLKLEARLAAATGAAGDEQVALLEQIVEIDPLDGEALILLGQHHASEGAVEKAAFLFERAAGLEKFEAEACLRHGQCLVRNARYRDALPLLKRAYELRPREDLSRYMEQVERVARMEN
jgi:tetratricopeptide (TPR) repeat protein